MKTSHLLLPRIKFLKHLTWESWEMLAAYPSYQGTLILVWGLWVEGGLCSNVHSSGVKLSSPWSGKQEAPGSNAMNYHYSYWDFKESTYSAGDADSILVWEDPLQRKWQPTPSILAWEIPWTEEPSSLQSMGSQTVRHDLVTETTMD